MTEETLGRSSCLPTSRPDLKPTQSPSLRGWRNTRLARKEQQYNSVDCDCARRLMDSKKPVFFNFSMQNINWLQESLILGVRAFTVRETQSDSGLILRKKLFISLVCYMRRRLQFVHNIFYHMKIRQVLSCAVSHQGLIFWESSIFQEKIEQRNKPCNNCF